MKQCNYCHVSKILDEFPLKKDGTRSGNCLLCKNKRKEKSFLKKKIITQKRKEYYKNNKEQILNERKEFYQDNKNTILDRNKKNYEKHKDEYLEYKKEYYQENRDEMLLAQKKDRLSNPEKYLLKAAKKRAKEKGLPFDISLEDIIIPDACPVFGFPLEVGTISERNNSPSLDKIIPELGYVKGNVKVISFKANSLKRDGLIEDFEKIISYIKENKDQNEEKTKTEYNLY